MSLTSKEHFNISLSTFKICPLLIHSDLWFGASNGLFNKAVLMTSYMAQNANMIDWYEWWIGKKLVRSGYHLH
jgi:hypothetical protein